MLTDYIFGTGNIPTDPPTSNQGSTTYLGRAVRWIQTSSIPRFTAAALLTGVCLFSLKHLVYAVHDFGITFFNLEFPADIPLQTQKNVLAFVRILSSMIAVVSSGAACASLFFAFEEFKRGRELYRGSQPTTAIN